MLCYAKSLQSCPTLCDTIDGSPPGSPVPLIFQARILEWVAISFSNAWKWKVKVKSLSHARLLATPWTAAYQAPPSMRFSRQEYWSGLPFPSPGDLLDPGWNSCLLHWQIGSLPLSHLRCPQQLNELVLKETQMSLRIQRSLTFLLRRLHKYTKVYSAF